MYLNRLKDLGITLTRSGKQKCPKCIGTKKNKSARDLSVTYENDRVLYRCHNDGCDFNGVVFMNEYKPIQKTNFKLPDKPVKADDQEAMYKYFESRKISRSTVDKYGVYMSGNKIVFPYYKNGVLVNNKYRWRTKDKEKNFYQEKDAEKTLFGMDLITDFSVLPIFEGEIDVLTMAEIGIHGVSVPQGGGANELDFIDNCYEFIEKFETFIIAVDNDEVGEKLKNNLISRLDRSKIKIAKYELDGNNGTESYKDANEVLCNCDYGEAFLEIVIDSAEPLPVTQIVRLNDGDIVDSVEDFYNNGYTKGHLTGWKELDKVINIQPGYIMVLAGMPSSGKSIWHKNLLFNLSKEYGWKHLIFDKEGNIDPCVADLSMMYTRKQFYEYNCYTGAKNENRMSIKELREARAWLNEHFIFFPRIEDWTASAIFDKAEECVKRFGIKTLTIDPFNKMVHELDKESMLVYINKFLRQCTSFAMKHNVFVTVIAHPAKPGFNKKQRVDMYDISGSADWYNACDYGVIARRKKEKIGYSNVTEIYIDKVKGEHLGNPSGGMVKFTKEKGMFVDHDKWKDMSKVEPF